MKVKKNLSLLLQKSNVMIFVALIIYPFSLMAQKEQVCNDNRPFYTKFFGSDTSVFITKYLFEHTPGLQSMSAAVNGIEIDCRTASFKFVLMRSNGILYVCQYDTVTLKTLDTLRNDIKKYEIRQGDILIFTDIKVVHFCSYPCNSYCYHEGLPMLKVIDTVRQAPRSMYMDVEKYLERNGRRKK